MASKATQRQQQAGYQVRKPRKTKTPSALRLAGNLAGGKTPWEVPDMLVKDPVLEDIDREVWVALRNCWHFFDRMPSPRQLMPLTHAKDEETIVRSLSILRSLGWITIHHSTKFDEHDSGTTPQWMIREYLGAYTKGYTVNAEPLQWTETTLYDDEFMDWIGETEKGLHCKHPRAIAVAKKVYGDYVEQMHVHQNNLEWLELPMMWRLKAIRFLESLAAGYPEGRFYNVSARTVRELAGL